MDSFDERPIEFPAPAMPDLQPGDLVRIELPDATYSAIVSTFRRDMRFPGTAADEEVHITFWTEPALDDPA